MQANWIGRSAGLEIDFEIAGAVAGQATPLTVYTTRPDTLHGATYMALAADHPLAAAAAERDAELAAFCADCRRAGTAEAGLETREKRGYRLDDAAIHPLSGEPLPIYVANFVLMGYGTGAVMSVPAHDQRDWEFARAYDLPIVPVVADGDGNTPDISRGATVDKGRLINSGADDGLDFEAAFRGYRRPAGRTRRGPAQDPVSPARLGHLTPALLGRADSHHPLPGLWPGGGAGSRSAGSAARRRDPGGRRLAAGEHAGVREL